MSEVNEVLAKLFDKNTVTVDVNGIATEVQVKKVTLRTLAPTTKLVADVFSDLGVTSAATIQLDLDNPSSILKLISNRFEQAIDVAAQLCSLDKDTLLDLPLDASVLVIQGIVLVNQRFFTEQVAPKFKAFATEEKAEGAAAK